MRAAIVAFCLATSACEADPGTAIDGGDLYLKFCATCHGTAGRPNAVMIARMNVRDLTSAELRVRITPELVARQIRTGSQNQLMPSFAGALSEAQITAIAAWVASPKFLAPR